MSPLVYEDIRYTFLFQIKLILLSQLRSFQIIQYALRKISFLKLAHGASKGASLGLERETENKEREEDGSKKEKG